MADPKRFDSVPYPAFHLVSDPAKIPDPFIFNQIKLQKKFRSRVPVGMQNKNKK